MASFRRRSSVQDLPPSESLCCKLCLGLYRQPKLLSCLHSFCFNCLKSYTVKRQEELCIQCPSCMEYTNLYEKGVDGLLDNTILEKCIQRNIKRFENASEQSETAVRMIRPSVSIDENVDSVLVSESSPDNSSDKEKIFQCRRDLQNKLATLQNEAVNIVHTIDRLNEENNRHYKQKCNVQEQIHGRAKLLIETVKRIERKLICQLESYENENSSLSQTQHGKAKLHKTLRKVLSLVDFIRLLLSSAGAEDIVRFQDVVEEKFTAMSEDIVHVDRTEPLFDASVVDIEEAIEGLFGDIGLKTVSEDVWAYGQKEDQSLLQNIFNVLKHSNPVGKKHISFAKDDENDGKICSENDMSKSLQYEDFAKRGSPSSPEKLSSADLTLSDYQLKKKCTNLKTRLNQIENSEWIISNQSPEKESQSCETDLKHLQTDTRNISQPSITQGEETNLNKNALKDRPESLGSDEKSDTSYTRSKSSEYLKRRANRRHTVGAIQDEIQQSDQRWKTLFPTLPPRSAKQTTKHLNDQLQSTRNLVNICRRQLAEAKTSILKDETDVYLNREEPVLMTERFEQLRDSLRLKSNKVRSYSADYSE